MSEETFERCYLCIESSLIATIFNLRQLTVLQYVKFVVSQGRTLVACEAIFLSLHFYLRPNIPQADLSRLIRHCQHITATRECDCRDSS